MKERSRCASIANEHCFGMSWLEDNSIQLNVFYRISRPLQFRYVL